MSHLVYTKSSVELSFVESQTYDKIKVNDQLVFISCLGASRVALYYSIFTRNITCLFSNFSCWS